MIMTQRTRRDQGKDESDPMSKRRLFTELRNGRQASGWACIWYGDGIVRGARVADLGDNNSVRRLRRGGKGTVGFTRHMRMCSGSMSYTGQR